MKLFLKEKVTNEQLEMLGFKKKYYYNRYKNREESTYYYHNYKCKDINERLQNITIYKYNSGGIIKNEIHLISQSFKITAILKKLFEMHDKNIIEFIE